MEFNVLKTATAKQFELMQKYPMFRVSLNKDLLYANYIHSFPAGTNEMFRERTEHECSCCRSFIRSIGDVVAYIDGKLVTIWDINVADKEPGYQVVADSMAEFVKSSNKVSDIFLHYENKAGTDKNFEDIIGKVTTWEHFFVNIKPQFVKKNADIPSALAIPRDTKQVLTRGLKEITLDSLDTVLELVDQNSLLRGQEFKHTLSEFRKLKVEFDKLKNDFERDMFGWTKALTINGAVAGLNNSAIGTLLNELSEGIELDYAVNSYERKVGGDSYKRPTALVTKGMIDKAKNTIEEMGLTSALERRYATLSDISINNVLFANSDTRKAISNDVFDTISPTKNNKKLDKVEEVFIEKFLEDILPKADSIEIMLDNEHVSNLVSLIAPIDPTAGNLFKWDNKFSWSYNGDVADSIKERVKQAGGNVTGDLCCRLSWFNYDDLDIYLEEPSGNVINFRNRKSTQSGGTLDVDMNAGGGSTRTPVENIYFPNKRNMKEGKYRLYVNCWTTRETKDKGFQVEVDFLGNVNSFSYQKGMKPGENVTVAEFNYTHKNGIEFISGLPSSTRSTEVWGIKTKEFQKVNVVMLSPNYWDDKEIGNKHYFFMIDGCANESGARGFYNEFLHKDLDKHRKVLEVVGNKLKTATASEQLSGVGFSSTQKNSLLCQVKGSFTRVVKIVF